MSKLSEVDKRRFWGKIKVKSTEECWDWKASCNKAGYGQFRMPDEKKLAHRVSYTIATGEDPGKLEVCHKCDRPQCCNPNHLYLGTRQQNQRDMARRDRSLYGSKCRFAKLSKEKVLQILKLIDGTKLTYGEIGEIFGVKHNTVFYISSGKNWKRVWEEYQNMTSIEKEKIEMTHS